MDQRVRVALALLLFCSAAPARPDEPAPPKPAAADAQLPAQIERIAIRDTVERDGRFERATDVQVLVRDPSGVAQFGQIGSAFIDGFGEVTFDRVAIQKPHGGRVSVVNGKVEDINPFGMSGAPVPADVRVRRMTVPGLEPGDRLTYRMTVRQKALIPNVTSGEFKFIVGPLASEQVYELDAPSDLRLNVWRRPDVGAQWESVAAPSGRSLRRLTVHAPIPTPKDDEPSDVLSEPDVVYSTFSSWEDVGTWWWGVSRDRFRPDAAIRAEAERLVKDRSDLRARVDALHAFVSGQVRYLSVGFGAGRYEPRPASEVLSSRYGDCKGKHALLAALGAAAGIEVLPALIHSARNDLHDEVPGPTQFDHLISVVRQGPDPAEWLWIDSTNDLARAGHLLPNLRGKRALVMSPQGVRVVNTPERPPFKTTWSVDSAGSIDPAGPIRARVRWEVRSDYETMLRAVFRMAPREKWNDAGKDLASEWPTSEVTDVKAGDPADLREPFWVDYAVMFPMRAKILESAWSFWIPLPETSLPAPDKNATSGDVIAKIESSDEVVIRARFEMPEGMKARAPLSVTLDQPFAAYRSQYAVDGRTLTVERVLQVKQRTITAEQRAAYEAFRDAVTKDRKQAFPIDAFRATTPVAIVETADDLNEAGDDALDRGDAKAAEAMYRQATEKEAQHKLAWNNLGLALRRQGRHEEALKAFTRQIEVNPYDPYAYDNRGAVLAFDLKRLEDGEKDFLKQIEVAPLQPLAYRDLAAVRTSQQRFAEAADLLDRAAAAKPSDSSTLLQLVWARARAGKGDVVGPAERVAAADRPQYAIIAARAVAASGDAAGAARIAREALPKLIASLPSIDASHPDIAEKDVLLLGEAWRLIGAAALSAADLPTADRYLSAAFNIAFTEDAALELAALREKQGRGKEAAELREQAPAFSRGQAGSLRKGTSLASAKGPYPSTITLSGASTMIGLRHIKELPGPPLTERVDVRVRLTVDASGRVTDVHPRDSEGAPQLKLVRDRIVGLSILSGNPDKATFKVARGATVACFKGMACHLGINILADEVAFMLER